MKKGLSILLALVMMLSIFTVIPVSVSAQEMDLAETGKPTILWPSESCKTWTTYEGHKGIDIPASYGSDIRSAYSGVVKMKYTCSHNTYPNWYSCCVGNGTGLYILGDDGRYYNYAHMVYGSIPSNVNVGSRVSQGQVIGKVGNTGCAAGTHLHFSIYADDHYGTYLGAEPANQPYIYTINPAPSNAWIKASATSVYTGTSVTFTFGADNIGHANLYIKKDDVDWKYVDTASSGYSVTFTEPGTYAAFIAAIKGTEVIWSSKVYVTVSNPPILSNAWIKASATSVYTGTSVTFTFGADNIGHANLYIKKDDIDWKYVDTAPSGYSVTFTEPGTYAAFIAAIKGTEVIWSSKVYVTVSNLPVPGKPSFTEFEVHNWSDGSFGWLKLGWNKTANTTAYGIHIYDYNTGAEVKKYSYNNPDCTSATLYYNDIIPGHYKVQIKSYNAYNITAGDIREATFVEQATPTSAWVKATPATAPVGGEINFTFDGENCTSATNFYLTVKKGDSVIFDGSVNPERKTGKTLTFDTEGTYTAFVKAQLNGSVLSDTITFYVKEHPNSVALNEDNISIEKGKTRQLVATVKPDDAYEIVTWRSNAPSVAKVDEYGNVTGVGVGFAIIYAETVNGLSAPCIVQVLQNTQSIPGDADGDGEVTSIDATLIQRYDAWMDTGIDEDVLMNADVDGSGELEIVDATFIQRWLAFMDVPYAIGEKK